MFWRSYLCNLPSYVRLLIKAADSVPVFIARKTNIIRASNSILPIRKWTTRLTPGSVMYPGNSGSDALRKHKSDSILQVKGIMYVEYNTMEFCTIR